MPALTSLPVWLALCLPRGRNSGARELVRACSPGGTIRAFASLDETDARQLRKELAELWSTHNRGGDEYLEVIAVRAWDFTNAQTSSGTLPLRRTPQLRRS